MKRTGSIACCLLLLGCSGNQKLAKLDEALNDYAKAIRWSMYLNAADFQHKPSPPRSHYRKDIRVTAYEPVRKEQLEDGNVVLQSVEIRYYDQRVGKEISLLDAQKWRYDERQRRWFLATELPAFK